MTGSSVRLLIPTTTDHAPSCQSVLNKLYCTSCQVQRFTLITYNRNFPYVSNKNITDNNSKIVAHSKYIIHWSTRSYVPSFYIPVCMNCSHPSYSFDSVNCTRVFILLKHIKQVSTYPFIFYHKLSHNDGCNGVYICYRTMTSMQGNFATMHYITWLLSL